MGEIMSCSQISGVAGSGRGAGRTDDLPADVVDQTQIDDKNPPPPFQAYLNSETQRIS